jgi:hypothetical protein
MKRLLLLSVLVVLFGCEAQHTKRPTSHTSVSSYTDNCLRLCGESGVRNMGIGTITSRFECQCKPDRKILGACNIEQDSNGTIHIWKEGE